MKVQSTIVLTNFFLLIALCCPAQELSNNCFDYFAFDIPFTSDIKSATGSEFYQPDNRLKYRGVDSYTFWYLLKFTEDTEVDFSLFSLNYKDLYDPLVFRNSEDLICLPIVQGQAKPIPLKGIAAYTYGDSIDNQNIRQFSFSAKKGEEYYLGVVEIFGEGCGHKLFLNAHGNSTSIRAEKKDCMVKDDLSHLIDLTEKQRLLDEDMAFFPSAEDENKLMVESKELQNELDVGLKESSTPGDTLPIVPHLERETFSQIQLVETEQIEDLLVEDNAMHILREVEPEPIAVHKPETIDFRDWETGELIPAESIEVGQKIVLNKIYFHNNTYAFRFPAQYELEKLATFLEENPTVKLEIQGHSAGNTKKISPDPRYKDRSDGWNFKGSSFELSEERAEAVMDFLVKQGITADRFTTVGYGDRRKLIPNPIDFEESKMNMRVEIVFTER